MSKLTDKLDDEGRKYALNMIALWAAEQLGKRGEDANEFARDFLAKNAPAEQHQHVFDRLSQILLRRGVSTKAEILENMNACWSAARACFGRGASKLERQ